ncbi:TPA: TerD family protein [Providencia stuartii]|uniref:TerD family protein n=3 Tax=Providencia stuartii TaxID=588 RepID=A0AAJ1JG63_PROST|nr:MULTISPECIES: TerD family protein [Providencia]SST03541.1 tellurium resistance protein [Acinetobacter baumannii]AFH93292.1 putative tellurium resistance protein [Providencia stuartii MRSN 2154]AIN64298.1 tellurite resistance protein [Providencia stuartii]AMG68323.1 TerD family protein [Providencia stuartii]APG51292.1 tellurium resistance protein TerX [Providencia stuartii]
MSVSLKKGQGVSLKKSEYDLSSVTIGLGWDIKEEKKGFLGSLFGKQEEYDLDVIAFLCDANGKVADLGRMEGGQASLVDGDIIFFNSLRHKSGQIWLTGDNRTGAGDGDDEQIIVKLNTLDDKYAKIVFIVQIYNGKQLQQHFGKVQNAFIRAVDAKNVEMARFDLSGGAEFNHQRSMLFAELVREDSGWKLNAIGQPSDSDSFVSYLKDYC